MAFEVAGCGRVVAPVALVTLLLAGCASPPPGAYGTGSPVAEQGTYRVGRPYEIKGVWYYPTVDYDYDRTGVASWYGGQFEGRLTANGEIFDLNQLTAAHTTLPMPSIVQVTNLENGRSLQLRVNDRGPFVDGRLIDVSRRSAQLLGFESQGTTLVRVRVLREESIAAAEEAMHNSGQILVADADAGGAVSPSPAPSSPAAPPPAAPPPAAMAPVDTVPRWAAPIATTPSSAAPAEPSPRRTIHPPPPLAQMAMAPIAPPPESYVPPPARRGSPLSRFALIAPAEAAELPPAREPHAAVRRMSVPEKPSSPPRMAPAADGSSGGVYVQAGAFSVRDNAQRVQSRIARLGSAQVTTTSVKGVAMYRVRLGPFRSAAQADQLLARLVESGYPGARLVGD